MKQRNTGRKCIVYIYIYIFFAKASKTWKNLPTFFFLRFGRSFVITTQLPTYLPTHLPFFLLFACYRRINHRSVTCPHPDYDVSAYRVKAASEMCEVEREYFYVGFSIFILSFFSLFFSHILYLNYMYLNSSYLFIHSFFLFFFFVLFKFLEFFFVNQLFVENSKNLFIL